MHMLFLITFKVSSENGYGFFRPGLKTGVGNEDFKLEKGPTDKAKEPDPGGSDQQNLGYKKLKNRKTDRTVRSCSFSVFQFT